MKEWLLKEDKKNKVGRPRLADSIVLKKAVYLLIFSFILSFILIFGFICEIKNVNPVTYAYSLTLEKLVGNIRGDKNFLVTESYLKNGDFIIKFKPQEKVLQYQGKYKYVLYRLSDSKFKKVKEETFDIDTKEFSVKVKRNVNKNETYKINLYVLNASKITDSYAPKGFSFSKSKNQNEMYSYKIFTVKGKYSPINNEELKENKENKISVTTDYQDPRKFNVEVPNYSYNILVKYTDESSKDIILADYKNLNGISSYVVPCINKISNVTIKIWPNTSSKDEIENIKLSSWNLKQDKNNNYYISNTYLLKPEKTYID